MDDFFDIGDAVAAQIQIWHDVRLLRLRSCSLTLTAVAPRKASCFAASLLVNFQAANVNPIPVKKIEQNFVSSIECPPDLSKQQWVSDHLCVILFTAELALY